MNLPRAALPHTLTHHAEIPMDEPPGAALTITSPFKNARQHRSAWASGAVAFERAPRRPPRALHRRALAEPSLCLCVAEWAALQHIQNFFFFFFTFNYCYIYQGFQFKDIQGLEFIIYVFISYTMALHLIHIYTTDFGQQQQKNPNKIAHTPPLCRHRGTGRTAGSAFPELRPNYYDDFSPSFPLPWLHSSFLFPSSKPHTTGFHKRKYSKWSFRKVYYISESANSIYFEQSHVIFIFFSSTFSYA